ncbi:MAG: hypothetical protein EON47_05990, partial [Acetobacteraceae bacterium]
MMPADRDLAATGALLLAEARRIDRLSRPVTILAMAVLLLAPLLPTAPSRGGVAVLALVVVLGLGQAFTALRVAFDARLFAALGDGRAPATLAALDVALTGLGLLPDAKAGRPLPLPLRLAGAARLMRRQAALLLGQIL